MSKPLVVFFGTGPVAAKSLELLSEWADVETVITKPKPEHHRGSFPVLDVASRLGLKVLTVTDKKSLNELFATQPVTSQLAILVDFGIIVSQEVIDYFPLGILNSHFSLLPEWRGADPITFSILSGQPRTGVSVMLLVAGMDEGPILATGYQAISHQTSGVLTSELIELSDSLLRNSIPGYISGEHKLIDQFKIHEQQADYPSEATYSRKLTKDDSLLDFSKTATQLEREVRAFADWPKSRTTVANKEVTITAAHVQDGSGMVGSVWRDGKQFGFFTSDGILVVDSLKPAGKGDMSAEGFLAGYGKDL